LASSTAKPLVLVVTGTSGAGKGTLEKLLLERMPEVELAVSATTRDQRPGEQNGREYWFITAEDFESPVDEGEFRVRRSSVAAQRCARDRSHSGEWQKRCSTSKPTVRQAGSDPGLVAIFADHRRSRSSNAAAERATESSRFRFDSTWLANNKR
jgi:hypothetical protein